MDDVDPDKIARVLERHPVRCAVLYGSHVRGTATADSDVDVAVAFDDGLDSADRLELRVEVIADLIEALGTDDVDVAELDSIRPEVGLAALRSGRILFGDQKLLGRYRERFERETTDENHDERLRRFDAILERLEGQV